MWDERLLAALFWSGMFFANIAVIFMTVSSASRGQGVRNWVNFGIGGSFTVAVAQLSGFQPPAWTNHPFIALWSWVALILSLIIALRKPRKSHHLLPTT